MAKKTPPSTTTTVPAPAAKSSPAPGQSDPYGLGLGAPPPGATSTSTTAQDFIGPTGYQLPDTYKVPVSSYQDADAYGSYTVNLPQPVDVSPRYHVGDEFKPLSESWSPTRIAALQKQMVAVGLMDPRDFQLGYWDDKSIQSYRTLLGYANVSGQDDMQTLAQYQSVVSQFGKTTTTGKVRQPFIAQLTDPNSLRDTLDAVSVRTIGRGLTDAEKAAFVTSFQAAQQSTQKQAYDLQGDLDPSTGQYTGTGGTVTPPDPQSDAAAYIKQTNPTAVKEYNYLNAFKAFQSLLSGSGLS